MSTTQDLPSRTREMIARHSMLEQDTTVLAAVSGGVDSMVLLHILQALGYRVRAAHFDHDTRAGASAADAAFVQKQCAAIGVPCTVGRWRDWPVTLPDTPSFEMEARARRYAFLLDTARTQACVAIATGHHAGDQAETVLMRVLRGTGPGGLAGIPPVRSEDGVRIVRPLLACTRAEIEAWARSNDIPWREDVTNCDSATPRNRLRHELLPLLAAEYNPNVQEALARLAESARFEDDLLATLAAETLRAVERGDRLSRAPLVATHPALQRRAVLAWLKKHNIRPDHDALVDIMSFLACAETGQRLSLDAEHLLHAAGGEVLLIRNAESAPAPQALSVPGECEFLGQRVTATRLDEAPPGPPSAWCSQSRQLFDADRLGDALTLRTRRDGDVFTPLGMTGTRKLQDYFVDRRVPRPDRDRVPIVEAAGGIAWVVGHAPGAKFAITEATKRYVAIEATPCN